MKRTLAVAAVASLMALFGLTSQAAAQEGPMLTADPPAVPGPGEYTFTLTGSGWSVPLVFIVPCTLPGDQLTTATPIEEIVATMGAISQDACDTAAASPAPVGADGTFTVEVTQDVPANFAFGAGDAGGVESSGVPILFIAEDMGDDMAPEGGADTGFGGMAGSDGSGVAVPLAATLAGVILLSGTAVRLRRNN